MFNPFPTRSTRIGFHYFPDTLHFRDTDLQTWLPELASLGASWLVLHSAVERAVPEFFLAALLQAGIEPVVQFDLNPVSPPPVSELTTIFDAYARWGIHGIQLFDRPNARSSWPVGGWAQQGLVERYLDAMLPLANAALQSGLNPLFPSLEPGGSFWDTAFLRACLETLERRKQIALLENLVLTVHTWTHKHPLDWGAGGPGRWPAARPYANPVGGQDQRGFRIFEWYQAVAQKVTGSSVPVLLLEAGIELDPNRPAAVQTPAEHARLTGQISALLAGRTVAADALAPIPPLPEYVLGAAFWLLAAAGQDPAVPQAWYQESGVFNPSIVALKQLATELRAEGMQGARVFDPNHPLDHYLLVPTYEWGIADYHLDVIRPFIKRHKPVMGFSLAEARLAREVTVIGSATSFPEEQLEDLRHAGCKVRRIDGDGMSIATELSER